ncbi:hypothetical protein [Streptomyces sp. NPDC058307]|uniref:hypothetical protein n=1 Tax=Streptomyces sp. NPDC058307 TaxID=3346439 RepID=UPI0036E36CC8
MPSILWSLAHRHPLRSLPVLRRYQLLNRWRLFAMARVGADEEAVIVPALRAGVRG